MEAKTNMVLSPISQKTCSEIIRESIVKYIHENKLKAGDRLVSDREMANMLQCSRTVVREALKGLESVGVVDMQIGKGTFVAEFTISNLLEQYHPVLSSQIKYLECQREARLAIEIGVIGLAVARAEQQDIDRLRAIADEMDMTDDEVELIELDVKFHEMLSSIARSPLLAEFSGLLRKFFAMSHREFAEMYHNEAKARESNTATRSQHRALIGCIENKDKEAAIQILEEHLALPIDTQNAEPGKGTRKV